MERRKGTLHTLIRGPWGRQNFFIPKQQYLVLAASGARDQDVWGVYGCNFSWWFQWNHRRTGGRVRCRRLEISCAQKDECWVEVPLFLTIQFANRNRRGSKVSNGHKQSSWIIVGCLLPYDNCCNLNKGFIRPHSYCIVVMATILKRKRRKASIMVLWHSRKLSTT